MELLVVIGCIAFAIIVEQLYNSHLDALPKDRRDKMIQKQSEMTCPFCQGSNFEAVGMKHGKLKFQCRSCKRMR